MMNARRSAAYVVGRWLRTKEFPGDLLPSGPDRAFVQDVVYTTVRRLRPLRRILGELLEKWPKGEMEALLYVGAAQILYMPDVPDFAAVNETVEAAKECPSPGVVRVVNAVLRNLVRRRAEFEAMIASAPAAERESFPGELYRRWEARWGAEGAERLAKWHNEPAVTYIARRDGSFVALERGERVESVKGYQEGEFIVQDPATAIAVALLDPKPGEKILDLCAAPGGKSVQIAWRGADLTACEVNPRRRRRLEENLLRVGVSARVVGSVEECERGAYAKVLVDAPCSNTGVIRRRPDARWGWSVEKMSALVRMQSEILDAASALVAPGGTLVYSTCSNEPEENSHQVEVFVSRHPEFTLAESKESVPFESGHDGAFAAALVRKAQE